MNELRFICLKECKLPGNVFGLYSSTERISTYRDAGTSLAQPERKQARKNVRRRARFQQHRDASCHQVFFFL